MEVRRPGPALAPFVERLWASRPQVLPHAREWVLPTGCADLIVMLGRSHLLRPVDTAGSGMTAWRGGVLQGAFDRPFVRDTSQPTEAVGAHFKPGALAAFIGDRADLLANRPISLADFCGHEADGLLDRLHAAEDRLSVFEAWLGERLHRAPPPDALVQRALSALAAAPFEARIGALQRASGCSPALFIRRFREAVGLPPKRYARVLRLSALLQDLSSGSELARAGWSAAALHAGYADQAHLAHEFRRLAGLTPGAWRPVAPDRPQHVAVAAAPAQKSTRQPARPGAACAPWAHRTASTKSSPT